jgi:hypothetical protein
LFFCGFKISLNKEKENICVIKTTAFPEIKNKDLP